MILSQIRDVLYKSITLLNRTNEQVQLNREALIRIADATQNIHTEIRRFYNGLYFELFPEFLYVHMISRLQAVYNLVSTTIRQMHLTLTSLLIQLQSSVQGDLSHSLIHPADLFNVLANIKTDLPSSIELPYPLTREGLLLYYQYLKPMFIPVKDSFHVVMVVPLIHTETAYEINRAVHVPIHHSLPHLVLYIPLKPPILPFRAIIIILSPSSYMKLLLAFVVQYVNLHAQN